MQLIRSPGLLYWASAGSSQKCIWLTPLTLSFSQLLLSLDIFPVY